MTGNHFSTVLVIFLLAAAAGCGNSDDGPGGNPVPQTATVQFIYVAATSLDPLVASNFPQCVNGVGRTHLHAGWRQFAAQNMVAAGNDQWQLTYNDVPINRDVSFRINDPNGCDTDPNGAVTADIFANGVRLTRIVGTPGNGTEPGLTFRVSAAGVVTP